MQRFPSAVTLPNVIQTGPRDRLHGWEGVRRVPPLSERENALGASSAAFPGCGFRRLSSRLTSRDWKVPRTGRLESLPYERSASAFTLIELLVVIVIIGILASIALPAMKGIGQANLTSSVSRQILDDLAFARLRAINERTTVYVVFVPPNVFQRFDQLQGNPQELRHLTNLLTGQYTAYALLSARTVGDQLGRPIPRYLTDWKTIPDGMLLAPYLFNPQNRNHPNEYLRSLSTNAFPFPNSRSSLFALPYIGFNAQGQLLSRRDQVIGLARGSIFYPRDNSGNLLRAAADVQLIPPRSGTNDFLYVRINWLTGRARIELPDFKE